MTYYTATYDDDGIELEDELNHYNLPDALKEGKKIADRNGWTLVSVKPRPLVPTPIIQQSCGCHREPLRRELSPTLMG